MAATGKLCLPLVTNVNPQLRSLKSEGLICLDERAGRKLQKWKKCELYCAEEQLLLAQTLWKAAASETE